MSRAPFLCVCQLRLKLLTLEIFGRFILLFEAVLISFRGISAGKLSVIILEHTISKDLAASTEYLLCRSFRADGKLYIIQPARGRKKPPHDPCQSAKICRVTYYLKPDNLSAIIPLDARDHSKLSMVQP